ncbi:MAG: hypothetical protein IPP32_12655 [Bacteroidetes bacterium]|nr:hypothetical protein [Bacteroidota bacterium]
MAHSKQLENKRLKPLTEKEIKIIVLICQEYTNTEIAEILTIKIRTLEWIRAKIMVKVKVKKFNWSL